MASTPGTSNKAKIARRVIEVLDYFDENHREATVMDIVRRYNRPQSSTSELLSSLVELGLLYKDPYSRSYSLSPRAALLGSSGQDEIVRDGRLVRLLDRVSAQTGLSVALFGMVGLNAQILSWRPGPRGSSAAQRALFGGMQDRLTDCAVGPLLLSTVDQRRCEGMVRRLNAEAADDRKFSFPEMMGAIRDCREQGFASGSVGFGSQAGLIAVLIPSDKHARPMAIGIVLDRDDTASPANLLACLEDALRNSLGDAPVDEAKVRWLQNAA